MKHNKQILEDHLAELAEKMTAAEISRFLGIPDATIRDNLMRMGITAQRPSVKRINDRVTSYKGHDIIRTYSGYTVNSSGVLYVSEDVAKKCIDVYLERTKDLAIKQKL